MLFDKLLRRKPVGLSTHDAEEPHHIPMAKVLSVRDLTFFGIAAIIGAGIFSSIGSACFNGGPAVILLFLMCAVACGFTAMCYAEFASRVPLSGSAYTYAYVSFGEVFAWIIGWALIMEYSIGNIYVAFSWSGYFTNLLQACHIHISYWLTSNYTESHAAFNKAASFTADYAHHILGHASKVSVFFKDWLASEEVQESINHGGTIQQLFTKTHTEQIRTEEYQSWVKAPMVGGLRIIFDLPAVLINLIITWLVIVGVKESKNVSNFMVVIKLAIIG